MHTITLSTETDFAGWRDAARAMVLDGVQPGDVTWTVAGDDPELFSSDVSSDTLASDRLASDRLASDTLSTNTATNTPPRVKTSGATFNVPARFVDLAKSAILHRDPERFAILYRLLTRIHADHDLMQVATDRDVALVQDMAKAVHRDQHKMKAFVRFREIGREPKNRFVAWFEPAHHIVAATSPFFERRFADMEWSILTPDVCAHWNGARRLNHARRR